MIKLISKIEKKLLIKKRMKNKDLTEEQAKKNIEEDYEVQERPEEV